MRDYGPVAQRLVQGTHNPLVEGSNPSGPIQPPFLEPPDRLARQPRTVDSQAGLSLPEKARSVLARIDNIELCRSARSL